MFGQFFLGYFRKLLLDVCKGAILLLHHFFHEGLFLVGQLPDRLLDLFFLHFLHQQGQICIFFKVPRKHLLVLRQKLLIVLFRDELSLVFHQLHVSHVKLGTRLDLLDYVYQVLARQLQLPIIHASVLQSLVVGLLVLQLEGVHQQLLIFVELLAIIHLLYPTTMSSYLDNLNNFYSSYEDYLHRRSKLPVTSSQIYEPVRRSCYNCDTIVNTAPASKVESKTTYYPVQRTEVEYKDNTVIEKVPKKKKIVEYVQRKEVELVPKEVSTIDYYAVEHIRQYVRQVVPEIKIETVQVPKVIKNIEHIPVEKQIVFYPSYLTDMEQIKRQARSILEKQGVVVRQDAEYRPILQKNQSLIAAKPIVASTKYSRVSPERSYLRSSPERSYLRSSPERSYLRPSPSHLYNRSPERYLDSSIGHNKIPRYSRYPLYNKQKYNFRRPDYSLNDSQDYQFNPAKTLQPSSDYTFAQKDQYRYDLAMHNSFTRLSHV